MQYSVEFSVVNRACVTYKLNSIRSNETYPHPAPFYAASNVNIAAKQEHIHSEAHTHTHTHTHTFVSIVKPSWILLQQDMMEVAGSLKSFGQIITPPSKYQHSVFVGQMPVLLPTRQRQSTRGKN